MSLSDTAEYWWEVKRNPNRWGSNSFIHIKDIDCGHNHNFVSNDVERINCHACKKLLTPELKAILAEKNVKDLQKAEQSVRDKQRHWEKAGILCTCGCKMVERMNSKTKEKFLGCSSYPACKNTKPL